MGTEIIMRMPGSTSSSLTPRESSTQHCQKQEICLSKIPVGTILPARHYFTGQQNEVKVGKVATYSSPADTVKQPVYLRQGTGLFLKKFLKPRRDHYGKDPPKRLEYKDNETGDWTDNSFIKALYHPNVIMTTEPITAKMLKKRQWKNLVQSSVEDSSQDVEDSGTLTAAIRSQLCFRISSRQKSMHKSLESLPDKHAGEYVYYNQGEIVKGPTFYYAPPLFSAPSQGSESPDESDEEEDTVPPVIPRTIPKSQGKGCLRKPLPPAVFRGRESEEHPLEDYRHILLAMSLKRREKAISHDYMPIVVDSSLDQALKPVALTTSRVQESLVNLNDLFPYAAEKGLEAEIKFYQREKHFPLLLKRNSKVNLEQFELLNSVRVLPPYRVLRAISLTRRLEKQENLTKELLEGRLPDDVTILGKSDDVFNPTTYPFNKDLRKQVYDVLKESKKMNSQSPTV